MTLLADQMTLDELTSLCRDRLIKVYDHYLSQPLTDSLKQPMAYSLKNVGKLIRPLLIYASGQCVSAPLDALDPPAAAVEIIHTYSLIHDDLPCMDNADLRRGKKTLHKVYNDAIAVLTGDALLTLSIQILASHPANLTAEQRVRMIEALTHACGPYGMAAGQTLDITLMQTQDVSSDTLLDIYRLKTGALFTACLELGYLASGAPNEKAKSALLTFGDHIGLAFQIQDDILDIESSAETLGKPQGLDATNEKITYPKLVGLLQAKADVDKHYKAALQAIAPFGDKAKLLHDVTGTLLGRTR